TRVYEGLGWAVLADDTAFPNLRMSARGGSSRIRGHGHLDLLAFKCMVNGVRMISDQRGGLMSVNYTGRGHDLYSRSAAAKSTLLVDGLGCDENTETGPTETVHGDGIAGIRLDGSKIYMRRWGRQFIGRLLLLVDGSYWLVVDTAPGRVMESRFHTYADVESGTDWAILKKGGETLTMTFASLDQSVMQRSRGMPTRPAEQTKILRWVNRDRTRNSLHVTAMNPTDAKLAVDLARDDQGFVITVKGEDQPERKIRLTKELRLRSE
ncbi:MAG: heparinase II/III family protein, partial [Phycisphaeraceae bacterium]|nr:heparinase II/III family protein [Phycisphaeraceae bacterium]